MNSNRRRREAEDGFTLIELLVVVFIIALLLAIAVPTFAGARSRAQDRATQTILRNALVVGEVFYADEQHFNATAAELTAIEPDMEFDDNVANASKLMTGVNASRSEVVFVRQSGTDTYFCIGKSENSPGTSYGSASTIESIDTLPECSDPAW